MSDPMHDLERWLSEKGYRLGSRAPPSTTTHFLLDGGKLAVPMEDNGHFLDLLADDIWAGKVWHIVERRTPFFKMFVDVDLKDPPDTFTPLTLWTTLNEVMLELYGDAIHAVVCTPASHDRESIGHLNSPMFDKYNKGGHVTWNVVVDSQTAMAIRERMLESCRSLDDELNWANILDTAVYKGSGIRMMGCHKGTPLSTVYVPLWEFHGNNAISVSHFDPSKVRRLLRKTSVRSAQTAVDDVLIELEPTSSKRRRKNTTTVVNTDVEELQDIVYQILPVVYRSAPLNVKSCGVLRKVPFWNIDSRSRHCMNKGGSHKSNHVWFKVTPFKVVQKCYDETHVGPYGVCKKFSSHPIPVPEHLSKRLLQLHDFR